MICCLYLHTLFCPIINFRHLRLFILFLISMNYKGQKIFKLVKQILLWIFSKNASSANALEGIMSHTHCTGPGPGLGQRTIVFYCTIPISVPVLVLCSVYESSLPPANVVCEGYVFTGVCHSFCSQGGHAWFYSGGACVVLFRGMCVVLFGGHAWFYSGGGVHGFIRGACMVLFGGACMVLFGGHAWFYSGGRAWFYSGGMHGFIWGGMRGFIRGGMHGFIRGGMHGFIWGACVVLFGGGRAWFFQFFRYNEIRSMSGRYASYWNAFSFMIKSQALCFNNYLIGDTKT